nr:hypothetical protein [Polyangium fumosum]
MERDAAGVAHHRGALHDVDDLARLANVPLGELIPLDVPTQQPRDLLEIDLEIFGVGDVLKAQALELFATVTDDIAERTVDADEAAVEAHQRHSDGRVVDRTVEAFFHIAEHLLGTRELVDVFEQSLLRPGPVERPREHGGERHDDGLLLVAIGELVPDATRDRPEDLPCGDERRHDHDLHLATRNDRASIDECAGLGHGRLDTKGAPHCDDLGHEGGSLRGRDLRYPGKGRARDAVLREQPKRWTVDKAVQAGDPRVEMTLELHEERFDHVFRRAGAGSERRHGFADGERDPPPGGSPPCPGFAARSTSDFARSGLETDASGSRFTARLMQAARPPTNIRPTWCTGHSRSSANCRARQERARLRVLCQTDPRPSRRTAPWHAKRPAC